MALKDYIIPKTFLQHGYWYAGHCRNATLARWDSRTGLFYYWREKFGRVFIESIEYWDPDGRFDQFIPVLMVGPQLPQDIPIDLEAM